LIQSLKRKLGTQDPVLARMTQGTANPGVNAPFILSSATSDPKAVERAEDWLARHPYFKPTEPTEKFEAVKVAPVRTEPEPEPEPEPGERETSRTISQLERLAQMAKEGANRLPQPPPERYPY
jgi:hypothetical protein